MKRKHCVVCGNSDGYTPERNSNLTKADTVVRHCPDCGSPVCGFCDHLGVCCDAAEDELTEDEKAQWNMEYNTVID